MFHLMAYNKDQDRYNELQSGILQEMQAEALFCRDLLRSDDLRDASDDLYDLAVKSGLVTLNGWRMKAERNTK